MCPRSLIIPAGALLLAAGLIMSGCAGQTAVTKPGAPGSEDVAPAVSSRELFMEKCSHCHQAMQAYSVVEERERWIKLVATMATKNLNWIDTGEMRVIINYHDEHHQVAVDLFQGKCGECHQLDRLSLLEKTSAQWRTMIKFMGTRSTGGLNEDETEMLYFLLA